MKDFMKEKEYLEHSAPIANGLYTNDELINVLVGFQNAVSHVMFTSGISEQISPRGITSILERLVRENGVETDETFERLCMNMKNLGFTIGSLKKGAKGEKRAHEGLRNLEFSPNVKILYNVTLDDGNDRTEYDAIVVTLYGIFVVEAKNFNGNAWITEKGILIRDDDRFGSYNLGENMNRKEFLLRSCIGDLASAPYHALLLYVNEGADVRDDYHQIPITYCNTVAKAIRQFDQGDVLITPEEINLIVTRITNHQIDARYPCSIDCNQIISDLILIFERISSAKETTDLPQMQECAHVNLVPSVPSASEVTLPYPWYKKAGWALLGAALVGTGVGGNALYKRNHSN